MVFLFDKSNLISITKIHPNEFLTSTDSTPKLMVSLNHMYGFSTNSYGERPMKTTKIKIEGMSCKACSTKVEKGLKELEGMHTVKVDLANDSANVTFDSDKITEKEIEAKIEETGYSIKGKKSNKNETKNTILQGITYGLVPHIGCIGFIVASILGVTFAAEIFKPLLLNPLFFYGLIVLSIIFATISSVIYLKNNDLLSLQGIKKKTNYLLVMYGTTIGVSLLFLFVIFPMLVTSIPASIDTQTTQNLSAGTSNGTNTALTTTNTTPLTQNGTLKLEVQIPCAGHSPLIISELKKLPGVTGAKMLNWNTFQVTFDTTKTSKERILAAEIFKSYPAKVIN